MNRIVAILRIPSIRRIIIWSTGLLFSAQLAVIAILQGMSYLRKRRSSPAQFPHGAPSLATIDKTNLKIYTHGEELYLDMLAEIEKAQKCIYFETFIWKNDDLGNAFKELLIRKANEGVAVYVIFDGFANLVVSPAFKHFPPSVHALEYRSLTRAWYTLDPRRYARDHQKTLIIDNHVAFIGGFNIGKLYATEWRDTHMRMYGAAAADLAYAFTDFWNTHRRKQAPLAATIPITWPEHIRVYRNDAARLVLPIRGMYLDAINRARSHVYITNAYFIPDRVILSALIAAAQRGVDVRILLPWQSNHVTADWLARGFFTTCLRSGIRIFGYQNAMIHAKTGTIDGIWSTIGTANLDRLSLVGNYEMNVEVRDEEFAKDLEEIFKIDLSNTVEITLADWLRRPWYVRLGELILSPLRPLL